MPDIKLESPARNRVNAAWLRAQIETLGDALWNLGHAERLDAINDILRGVDWRGGK